MDLSDRKSGYVQLIMSHEPRACLHEGDEMVVLYICLGRSLVSLYKSSLCQRKYMWEKLVLQVKIIKT